MSTPAQRYSRGVCEMEASALALLRYAERFAANVTNTQDRVNRSEELLQAARRYATAVRRLARLRT